MRGKIYFSVAVGSGRPKGGHYVKNLRVGKATELDGKGQREEINTFLGTRHGAQREKGGRGERRMT